jgi:hypothetical protein
MSPISERAARHHLVKAAEAMVVRVGAKSFVHALTLKQLTAAMAGVPIDHGGNNPRNKQVLQKRFIEVLCELGPKVAITNSGRLSSSHPTHPRMCALVHRSMRVGSCAAWT